MKHSLLITGCFLLGIVGARIPLFSRVSDSLEIFALALLLLCLGISIGSDLSWVEAVWKRKCKLFFAPLGALAGTIAALAVFSLMTKSVDLHDAILIGSGMGYYSLPSILIEQAGQKQLGASALLSNMSREILSLALLPMLVRLHKIAPIAAIGSASDTAYPLIRRFSGAEYGMMAISNGVILTLIIPVLTTGLLTLWY